MLWYLGTSGTIGALVLAGLTIWGRRRTVAACAAHDVDMPPVAARYFRKSMIRAGLLAIWSWTLAVSTRLPSVSLTVAGILIATGAVFVVSMRSPKTCDVQAAFRELDRQRNGLDRKPTPEG